MKRLALVLLLMSSSASAAGLYGFDEHSFVSSPDRYAHPRSVEQYRKLVPDDDEYGMCRNAGHLGDCIKALHGMKVEEDANESVPEPDHSPLTRGELIEAHKCLNRKHLCNLSCNRVHDAGRDDIIEKGVCAE